MRILGKKKRTLYGMIYFLKNVIADTLVTKIKVPHKGGQKKRQLYKKKRRLSLWSQRFYPHCGYKTAISFTTARTGHQRTEN